MKISPVAAPIAPTQVDGVMPQAQRPTIKMRVNQTIHRELQPQDVIKEVLEEDKNQSPNLTNNVEQEPVAEETRPLSPLSVQFAKAKRALQVKERELAEREAKLNSQGVQTTNEDLMAKLKASPLSFLQEAGVTYDDLTQAILSSPQSPELMQLKNEMKALKDELTQQFTSRDKQAEEQVLSEMRREADALSREGDAYQFIREASMQQDVIDGMYEHYKATGTVPDLVETMNKLEERLVENALKAAQIAKVKARLNPEASLEQTEIQQPAQAPVNQVRTLTARHNARPTASDRKARAMAAFSGTLKR